MNKKALLSCFLLSIASCEPATASDADCLASILYAESRGEPLEGVIAIGQATLNRAAKQGQPVCRISGVKRKTPPVSMADYFKAIARQLLTKPSNSVAQQADSWNTGDKPRQPGQITRQIENHVFYILKASAE